MNHVEPLIVKMMLQSKLVTEVGVLDVYPQLNVILKSMLVDSSPKLTHDDWVNKQSEDSDIVALLIWLLKTNKLKKYVAREMDSLGIWVLLKYRKDLFLKNGLLY